MNIIASLVKEGFVPFAFGSRANLELLHPAPFGEQLLMLAADDPAQLPFHNFINRLNGLAYGGKDMGMPAWVQIDCGILPSAFIGFAVSAERLPEKLKWSLDIGSYQGLVPISEAISIPTAQPGRWMSYSMSTVIPGRKLGFASKVLSLKAYGCRSCLGVAQFDNFALRIHTRFGPLQIVEPHVPYHTCPTNSFVYGLDLQGGAILDTLERGGRVEDPREPSFLLHANNTEKMQEMALRSRQGSHRYWLLPPGAVRNEGVYNPILEEAL
ncbi:MAG: hypothetical protein CMP23_02960 [Rickettsiales bacterium]|nr:hypothetical protein [Rickettsiales bacterium]|tara:strand:- start:452 stop:1258 length:807 start_codon:yes stop_codon:yes gene_type:complete